MHDNILKLETAQDFLAFVKISTDIVSRGPSIGDNWASCYALSMQHKIELLVSNIDARILMVINIFTAMSHGCEKIDYH